MENNNNPGNPYGFPPNGPAPQQPTYDPYLGTPVPPQNIVENSSPYNNPASYQPQQTGTPSYDNTSFTNAQNNDTMNQPDYTQMNYSQPNPFNTTSPMQNNPYMNGYGTPVPPQPTYNPGPGNSLALQPRKKAPKWLWGFSIIPILAIVAVICFFTIPSVKDFVYKNFFSAQKYYERIEAKNNNDFLTSFADNIPNSTALTNQAFDGNLSFQIDPSLLNELGEGATIFSDLNCDIKYNLKDGKMVASYIIKKESTNLLTLNMYADIASQKIYLQIPELSDAYLDLSSLSSSALTGNLNFTSKESNLVQTMSLNEDAFATIQSYLSNIDYKEVFSILEKYMNLLFDEIAKNGKVSKASNVSLTAAGVSNEYTEFTVELNQKDLVAVVTNLLKAAKSDKQIIDLLSPLGVSTYYTSAIDSLLKQFDELKNDTSKDALKLISYVDSDDKIIGRSLHLISDSSELATISYAVVTGGKNIGYEMKVVENSTDTFMVSCKSEKSDTGYNGVASIVINSEPFDINFKDVTFIENEKSFGKLNGTFTVNIPEANDAKLEVITTAGEANQEVSVNFTQSDTKLLSIIFDTKKAEVTESVLPSESATYYDLSNEAAIEQYIENTNLESFLRDTFTKLGITDEATIAAIIEELTGTSTVTPPDIEDPTEGSGNDNNSNYDPTQYGLPAGTEIDEYGYFRFDLEEKDLVAGVAGTGYPVYNATKEQMQPTIDSILKKLYKAQYELTEKTENYVSGNVEFDLINTYQYETASYTDKENYLPTFEVIYDSVTKQLIKVTLNATLAKEDAIAMVEQILEAATGTTLSEEDKKSIKTDFDTATGSYSSIKLGTTNLYVSESGNNSYFITIEQY